MKINPWTFTQILPNQCSQDAWRLIALALQLSTLSRNEEPYSKANLPLFTIFLVVFTPLLLQKESKWLYIFSKRDFKAFNCSAKNKDNWINGRFATLLQKTLFIFFYLIFNQILPKFGTSSILIQLTNIYLLLT